MLVVVHHGYVERALQAFLYVETFRRLDVLKVDSSECRCYFLHCLAELLGVFLVNLDVEYVNSTVNLEQQSFTFHYRFAAHCANVAQAEHSGSVTDYSHQVALVSVFVGIVGILLNLEARVSHAR